MASRANRCPTLPWWHTGPIARLTRRARRTISGVTLFGVINDVQPTGLTIKAGRKSNAKNQTQWFVFAHSDTTEFTIQGTATPDYLRKGQIVEFSGQIVGNEKGADKAKEEKLADKLDELTIVARKGGAAGHNKGGAKDAAAKPGVAARIAAPKAGADPDTILIAPDDAGAKADDSGKPAAKQEAAANGAKKKIVGRIEKCDAKSLTVTCGQRTIHVDLADEPTIHVQVSDVKLILDSKDGSKSRLESKDTGGHLVPVPASDLIGAKIVVDGTAVLTKSSRRCAAERIEVTLAKPLTGKKSASPDAKKTVAEK